MELKKKFDSLSFTTLCLMMVYLFITVGHIFFLSAPIVTDSSGNHTLHFRKKNETCITVQRIDKTVLNENKLVNTIRNKVSFIMLHIKLPVLPVTPATKSQPKFLSGLHHTYLSNHVIRI